MSAAPPVRLASKAGTLEALRGRVRLSTILPQLAFTVAEWNAGARALIAAVQRRFAPEPLAVRSSARAEDQGGDSRAGRYRTCLGVRSSEPAEIEAAIRAVIESYDEPHADDQVLVQPCLGDVALAGVAFTRDPDTGAPYYLFEYDAASGRTDGVTSGRAAERETLVHFRLAPGAPRDARIAGVLEAVRELELVLGSSALDVEFAVTRGGEVVVLQARALPYRAERDALSEKELAEALERLRDRIAAARAPHPDLLGDRATYGVMPDWNPAEIIGVRPRPLALSLYQELVTDSIWAYQRGNYGYRNLRSFPLLIALGGQPYIDVRVDFNSFVPADLGEDLARRLVNFYLEKLRREPHAHDKVEFDVVFSCYTPDLTERLAPLRAAGFSDGELGELAGSLRRLTNRIIDPVLGLWRSDWARIRQLEGRQVTLEKSALPPLARLYWLLEDCKRYGTLPFAGIARAAFVAVQLLRSLVALGILTEEEHERFLRSLNTVARRMARDSGRLASGELERAGFLARYGHLRPGTYDILSSRYDEAFDTYFPPGSQSRPVLLEPPEFQLSEDQAFAIDALLRKHGLPGDAAALLRFCGETIEGREWAKFVFSRSVSDALRLVTALGTELGLSRDELSFLDVWTLQRAHVAVPLPDLRGQLEKSIELGMRQFRYTRELRLPSLLLEPDDVFGFAVDRSSPNFVGRGRIAAEVALPGSSPGASLAGRIALLERADPGCDWIFSHRIAGLVTEYGGANSHMAIRCAELGLPAVIGCGEQHWREWSRARMLEIDGGARQVRVIA